MEKIIIKNFAGIDNIELELNKINILIGAQATGKSIIVKLLYYFKNFFYDLEIFSELRKIKEKDIIDDRLKRFKKYFPKETWKDKAFEISYKNNNIFLSVKWDKKNLKFNYNENLKKIIDKNLLENKNRHNLQFLDNYTELSGFIKTLKQQISSPINNIFVPAGRSFFSNIHTNIYGLLNANETIDPFLVYFGHLLERTKQILKSEEFETLNDENFDKIAYEILNGKYIEESGNEFLLHSDNRKVNVLNASSGQQEILPLLLIFKVLKNIVKIKTTDYSAALYIEEPEAHLYPNAQMNIVKLLAQLHNTYNTDYQLFITTHSPYILSSFNNLIYAGYLIKKYQNKENEIIKIIDKNEIVNPEDVSVWALTNDKKLINAINQETLLIDQNILDDVSNKISSDFGKLMNLE